MSTFKDIDVTNTISIKEKPIYNHICDSYYDQISWKSDKYSDNTVHIYGYNDTINYKCIYEWGSLYYSGVVNTNIKVPNIKITDIYSYISNIDKNNQNGIFLLQNVKLTITEDGSLDWVWFVMSPIVVENITLKVYFDGWFKYVNV